MNLQKMSKLALALVMLLVGWSLLQGAGPVGYWHGLTGGAEERISNLKKAYGLNIHHGQGTPSLPRVWQLPPVDGHATPASTACVSTFMPVIQAELEKYRPDSLKSHFQNLYLYKTLTLFDVGYGATVQGSDIYLTVDCQAGYSEADVAKAFHHELSSLLLGAASFPTDEWSSANGEDFRYLDNDEQVLEAVSIEQDLMGSPEVYQEGFLAEYGKTTLENDINLYAEVAMVEPDRLADLVSQYPRVAVKARLLHEFYRPFVEDDFLNPPPVVDARAMEIQVVRYQGELYRLTRFSTESLYPCLRFERLLPGDWKIDAQRDICSVRDEQGDLVEFIDTSYTGFRSLRFEGGAFRFEVEYIPTRSSGERLLSCRLPAGDLERAGLLSCS